MVHYRVLVVVCANTVAAYVLRVMMTYLTDVWNLDLLHAAAITNIVMGTAEMLPMGMIFLADSVLGHYRMYIVSSILCCFGMSLLTISTAPVLSKVVGNAQKALFYAALPFIAVGFAGKFAFDKWLYESGKGELVADINLHVPGTMHKLLGFAIILLISIAGGIAIQYIKSWGTRFGISTTYMIFSTLLFLSGTCSYSNVNPPRSPFATFFRVFVASASKRSYALPTDANELYEKTEVNRVPHTNSLRFLDKAAIIVPNISREEQEKNKWKLCTVTEVEETKISLHMTPLWVNFALCGVVSSLGRTYFVEQGDQMNPYLGKLKVPLVMLLVFHDLVKCLFNCFCRRLRNMLQATRLRKYVPPIGMAMAILCSILCCITAAAIENRRLDVVKSHGLVEKPEGTKTPLSIFWLLPQFFFLGALHGISLFSVKRFFIDQAPESLRDYLFTMTKSVRGAGRMGSVVTAYAVGLVSEVGGKPSWFQDTLNKSRLDNCYWVLGVLSSINLVIFIIVATQFPYKDSDGGPSDEESETNDLAD